MNIIDCKCNDVDYGYTYDIFMQYDIVSITELIFKKNKIPYEIEYLIYEYIEDYLISKTLSFQNKNFVKSYLCKKLCVTTFIKYIYFYIYKEPNWKEIRKNIDYGLYTLSKELAIVNFIKLYDKHVYNKGIIPTSPYTEYGYGEYNNRHLYKKHYTPIIFHNDLLINSNTVIGFQMALYNNLSDIELIQLFKKIYNEPITKCNLESYKLNICDTCYPYFSGSGFDNINLVIECHWEKINKTELYEDIYHKLHIEENTLENNMDLKILLMLIYDHYDVSVLYDSLKIINNIQFLKLIIEMWQLPPTILNHILLKTQNHSSICINMIKYQKYLDIDIKKNIFNNLDEKSIANAIQKEYNIQGIEDEIVNKYPNLLEALIYKKILPIKTICQYKDKISKKCWKFISGNYKLSNDIIYKLDQYIIWKTFINQQIDKQKIPVKEQCYSKNNIEFDYIYD